MLTDPMTTIRGLKGAALACLLVLLIHKGQAMRAQSLMVWTGYSDKPITSALCALMAIGLVVKGERGYSLVDQFDFWTSTGEGLEEKSRRNSDFSDILLLTPSDTKSLLINNNIYREKSRRNSDFFPESRRNSDIEPDQDAEPVDNFQETVDNFPETVDNFLLEVLESYGIVGPKLTRLARLEGLTEEVIHSLVRQLKLQVGERYTTGLLVYALEQGGWRSTASASQDKYTTGQFADFVEH